MSIFSFNKKSYVYLNIKQERLVIFSKKTSFVDADLPFLFGGDQKSVRCFCLGYILGNLKTNVVNDIYEFIIEEDTITYNH